MNQYIAKVTITPDFVSLRDTKYPIGSLPPSGTGRFHRPDQLAYYAASGVSTAAAEVLGSADKPVVAPKALFDIPRGDYRVLDLVSFLEDHAERRHELFAQDGDRGHGHCQDVRDYLEAVGCSGVLYPSSAQQGGICVAIWPLDGTPLTSGFFAARQRGSISGEVKLYVQPATVAATGQVQPRLSVQHLLAAAHWSRQTGALEVAHKGEVFGSFFEEILWSATGSVFFCVAALEAYANELFIDREKNFPDLQPAIANRFWELFERKPMLEKFDLVCLLRNRPALPRGSQPAQDLQALIELRNALTHFKPEWEAEQDVHARVSKLLAGRFEGSPFFPVVGGLFPQRWATHSCTQWAVRSCLKYSETLEASADLHPKFGKFHSRLAP